MQPVSHPLFSRLVVSQGGFHVAVEVDDAGGAVEDACLFLDSVVEGTFGYLSLDREWSWIDRRHWYGPHATR